MLNPSIEPKVGLGVHAESDIDAVPDRTGKST